MVNDDEKALRGRVEVKWTRWQQVRRLEFLETCLFWEGRFNRAELCNRFRMSIPQATLDIKEYMKRAPGNCVYDPTERAYVATPNYSPKIIEPNADRYLEQLGATKTNKARERDIYVAGLPPFDVVPAPARPVRTETLRTILRAINQKQSLEIVYQSVSKDLPQARRITPHALGSDGLRWHARAFCHKDGVFKDFVLGRILTIGDPQPSDVNAADDWEWVTFQNITLKPNPELSTDQQAHIAADYGMENNVVTIKVRTALLFYFDKLLNRAGGEGKSAAAHPVVSSNLKMVLEVVNEQKKVREAAHMSVPYEPKLPLEANMAECLKIMEVMFGKLEGYVDPPERIELPNGIFHYRYVEKSVEQALVQKLTRVVSGLNGILALSMKGLYQEQGLVQRVVEEVNEDIYFLAGALFDQVTDLHKQYLDAFYSEEFLDFNDLVHSHVSKPMVSRNKIHAYIAKIYANESDQSRSIQVSKILHKAYSGYVHAASTHIMESYAGLPPRFHVSGMKDVAPSEIYIRDAWNYFYRGLLSFKLVAMAFNDDFVLNNLNAFIKQFERGAGKSYAFR